jgi:type III secretory pathway component EscS
MLNLFTTIQDFIMTMATVLFLMGLVSLGVGIFIMASQAMGKNVRTIANQTTKLAQKGIAEDVAGLVGNAGSLLSALNQLVKETVGIGVFLVIVSFILILGAYGLTTQLH